MATDASPSWRRVVNWFRLMDAGTSGPTQVGPSSPPLTLRRKVFIWVLALLMWGLANVVAAAAIRIYESLKLGETYDVPGSVIRDFSERNVRVELAIAKEKSFEMWYRYRPPGLLAGRHSTPLLIYLHGAGERGVDNVQQLRLVPRVLSESELKAEFPCAVLAPQCPARHSWGSDGLARPDFLDAVLVMLDEILEDSRIDPNRVYLTGFSMGSFGSWRLAARTPDRFAAVLPIAGGGNEEWGQQLSNVPLWAVHGAEDEAVSPEQSRRMIEAIRQAGGNPRYTELPEVGHGSWDDVFHVNSPYLSWMFMQRLNQRSTGKPSAPAG